MLDASTDYFRSAKIFGDRRRGVKDSRAPRVSHVPAFSCDVGCGYNSAITI
jgi:hypothetical protein